MVARRGPPNEHTAPARHQAQLRRRGREEGKVSHVVQVRSTRRYLPTRTSQCCQLAYSVAKRTPHICHSRIIFGMQKLSLYTLSIFFFRRDLFTAWHAEFCHSILFVGVGSTRHWILCTACSHGRSFAEPLCLHSDQLTIYSSPSYWSSRHLMDGSEMNLSTCLTDQVRGCWRNSSPVATLRCHAKAGHSA